MLAKDTVARRLNSEQGISFTEFSYQILQGMDFLELHRRHGVHACRPAAATSGATCSSGVELIRKAEGVAVHALTTPLITKADGTKFGKTESGTVWLDPEHDDARTPSTSSGSTPTTPTWSRYLKVFTLPLPRGDRASSSAAVAERPAAREAQRALAVRRDRRSCTAPRRPTRWSPRARRCSAAATSPTSTPRRSPRRSPSCRPRRAPAGDLVVDLLAATGVVAQQGGRAASDRRGRGVGQQRQGDRRGRGARPPTTCCTAAGPCSAAASGPSRWSTPRPERLPTRVSSPRGPVGPSSSFGV